MDKNMDKIKNKNSKLVIAFVLVALLVIGGTYALLTYDFLGINDNYTVAAECFKINYNIDNDDGSQNIEGILLPSADPGRGLSGKVSIGIAQSCNVTGTGTLKLHIGESSSSELTKTVAAHCENSGTLGSMDGKDDYKSCVSNGGNWVINGTALKYAVYNNKDGSGNPLSVGYIETDDINTDMTIYDNFLVDSNTLNLYIFIWLDGYLVDNSYINQPFDAYISAGVVQNEHGVSPAEPVLDDSGMIPVVIDNSGNVKTISADDENWYNYGEKKWANAILVSESSRASYLGTTDVPVTKSDILAYYVWIPKYSYKMNSSAGKGNESEISISFDYNKSGYISHPAFKFGDKHIDGFWTGKFETTGTATQPTILNGVKPLVSQTIDAQFTSSLLFAGGTFDDTNRTITFANSPTYGLSNTTDSHMMKNSEWGAVAYLSHSKYGTCVNGVCQEIRINNYNNNSTRQTGCGAATADTTSESTTCTLAYGSGISEYPQSTTGNITGVFDMVGGACEYVMGNYNNTKGSYWSYTNLPPTKYYDVYTTESACNTETCGGHALNETQGWYGDFAYFVNSTYPWFRRGGSHNSGANAAMWYFGRNYGNSFSNYSWRSVLVSSYNGMIVINVDGENCFVENGMTWGEFAESKYNTVGVYLYNNRVTGRHGYITFNDGFFVNITDVIIAGNYVSDSGWA